MKNDDDVFGSSDGRLSILAEPDCDHGTGVAVCVPGSGLLVKPSTAQRSRGSVADLSVLRCLEALCSELL